MLAAEVVVLITELVDLEDLEVVVQEVREMVLLHRQELKILEVEEVLVDIQHIDLEEMVVQESSSSLILHKA